MTPLPQEHDPRFYDDFIYNRVIQIINDTFRVRGGGRLSNVSRDIFWPTLNLTFELAQFIKAKYFILENN